MVSKSSFELKSAFLRFCVDVSVAGGREAATPWEWGTGLNFVQEGNFVRTAQRESNRISIRDVRG